MPRKSITRPIILDAVIQEIAAIGTAGVRVDAVAARAAVNKRMIYHHFGDRDGLVRAGLADLVKGLQADNVELVRMLAAEFGAVDSQTYMNSQTPVNSLAPAEILRVLVAEYLRLPRTESEHLLTSLLLADRHRERKPMIRLGGVTRPASRVSSLP